MLSTTYAATPEARAAYQSAGLELTCTSAPPASLATRSRSRRSRRRGRQSGPGCLRVSSHVGPSSSSRKPVFAATSAARHVAPEAVTCSQGDSLETPVSRVHQVSAARGRAARREAAGDDADRAAGRQRDVDRATHGEIAADGDEARAVQRRHCFVDGQRLDDAVQVERQARRPGEHSPRDDDLTPPAAERRIDEARSVSAATSSAISSVLAKSRETRSTCAGDAFTRDSSDSGRNRLNACSQRSSTPATVAGSPPATATSQPIARNRCTTSTLTTSSWRPAEAAPAARSDRPARRCAARRARRTRERRATSPYPSHGRARGLFAPTKATPKTSAVSRPMARFAVARSRSRELDAGVPDHAGAACRRSDESSM